MAGAPLFPLNPCQSPKEDRQALLPAVPTGIRAGETALEPRGPAVFPKSVAQGRLSRSIPRIPAGMLQPGTRVVPRGTPGLLPPSGFRAGNKGFIPGKYHFRHEWHRFSA